MSCPEWRNWWKGNGNRAADESGVASGFPKHGGRAALWPVAVLIMQGTCMGELILWNLKISRTAPFYHYELKFSIKKKRNQNTSILYLVCSAVSALHELECGKESATASQLLYISRYKVFWQIDLQMVLVIGLVTLHLHRFLSLIFQWNISRRFKEEGMLI